MAFNGEAFRQVRLDSSRSQSEKYISALGEKDLAIRTNSLADDFFKLHAWVKNETPDQAQLIENLYYQSINGTGSYASVQSDGLVVGYRGGFGKTEHKLFLPGGQGKNDRWWEYDLKFSLLFNKAVVPNMEYSGNRGFDKKVYFGFDEKHSFGKLQHYNGVFKTEDGVKVRFHLTRILDIGLTTAIINWQERLGSALKQVKDSKVPMSTESHDLYMGVGKQFSERLTDYEAWLKRDSGMGTAVMIKRSIELIVLGREAAEVGIG